MKPRVAVVFGGTSSEHAVSCVSAVSVVRSIDRTQYDVIAIGITPQGQWTLVDPDSVDYAFSAEGPLPQVQPSESSVCFSPALPSEEGRRELLLVAEDGTHSSLGEVDVVFPILHGPFGEDGTIQGLFELAQVRYVGAGVLTSAVGMDKDFMKRLFISAGLSVGPYRVVKDKAWQRSPDAVIDALTQDLDFPVFVKPSRAGSSVGITRVEGPEGLRAAITEARRHDLKVVVEEGIVGREIEVAVLGGAGTEGTRASLPGEIAVDETEAHSFYDFTAKYIEGDAAQLSCPAVMDEADVERVRELAVDAFDALDGEGLSRVDFFYTPDGRFVINEINTLPGFTPVSMYAALWDKSGIGYPELVSELIQLALNRPLGLR